MSNLSPCPTLAQTGRLPTYHQASTRLFTRQRHLVAAVGRATASPRPFVATNAGRPRWNRSPPMSASLSHDPRTACRVRRHHHVAAVAAAPPGRGHAKPTTPPGPGRRALASAAVAAVALSLVASPIGSASASAGRRHQTGAGPVVVASGLDNPRHLSFNPHGELFVAEAGRGGAGPCVPGPEGEACFGATGAVTRISPGRQQRVLDGLASVAAPGGAGASGPTGIQVTGRQKYVLSMGLGNDPARRADLGPQASTLGTVLTGTFASRPRVLADLAAYEAGAPGADGADSNPGGLTGGPSGVVIADAGANRVLSARPNGSVSVLAQLPDRPAPAPPFLGLPSGATIPAQSVPTSVTQGPDGAWYVSELTGFPFPAGGSVIWRVVPGQAPTQYATGLTNVTDLAWYRGRLYAVQLADSGLLTAQGLPTGSLVRVQRGGSSHTTVVGGLTAPYGVAFAGSGKRSYAYLTTCAMCAGQGQVIKAAIGKAPG